MNRLALIASALPFFACHPPPPVTGPGQALPDADRLFERDPRWLGGDAAYSVALGQGRTLWLFGDSFVTTAAGRDRRGATMVHNTVAIQRGRDPATASLTAFFGQGPTAFFAGKDGKWLWPGAGARLGRRLLLFLLRVERSDDPLGFAVVGSEARLIENPGAPPDRWRQRAIALPRNGWGVCLGTGAALVYEGHLLLVSVVEPGDHDAYLLRWPLARALAGDLSSPQWWTTAGWRRQREVRYPLRLFEEAQTEFSLHHDPRRGLFIEVQTIGFGATSIGVRTARAPQGPWSALRPVYRPPESSRAGLLVYAAKAHPQLSDPGLLVTYVAGSRDLGRLVADPSLYRPRFVRLPLAP